MVANFIFFQLLWFACVLGGGRFDSPLLVLAGSLPLLIWGFVNSQAHRAVGLLAAFVAVGTAMDATWMALGLFNYSGHDLLPPYWIVVLWGGVALCIDHSMAWFRDRPALGAAAAGLFAPFSYLGGESLGAAIDVQNLYLLPALSGSWLVAFYGLLSVARKTLSFSPARTP